CVVRKRPENVLLDTTHNFPGKLNSGRDIQKIILDKHDIPALDSNVGPAPYCDTYVCPGKGWSIVNAIPDECNHRSGCLERFHFPLFVFREYFCNNPADSHLASNCFRGSLVVSCNHRYRKPHVFELLYCVRSRFLDGVSNSNNSGIVPCNCDQDNGPAGLFEPYNLLVELRRYDDISLG